VLCFSSYRSVLLVPSIRIRILCQQQHLTMALHR
jgi:hypothetical protein